MDIYNLLDLISTTALIVVLSINAFIIWRHIKEIQQQVQNLGEIHTKYIMDTFQEKDRIKKILIPKASLKDLLRGKKLEGYDKKSRLPVELKFEKMHFDYVINIVESIKKRREKRIKAEAKETNEHTII